MIKLEFTNAVVRDLGYGVSVNGELLEGIISTALGTRVGNNISSNSDLPEFYSNCCNVTIIIDPQPVTTRIEDDDYVYDSVEDLEDVKREQFESKNEKTDPAE